MTHIPALLHEASRILARRGWHQGAASSHDGRVCVLQALGLAANCLAATYDDVDQARRRLERVVGRHAVTFNDDSHTSYEDVLLALKQAEELAP